LTPREIVAELDKFVVGQEQAKRMVAVAVRNRWRRQRLPEELLSFMIFRICSCPHPFWSFHCPIWSR